MSFNCRGEKLKTNPSARYRAQLVLDIMVAMFGAVDLMTLLAFSSKM
jgi:hypothetical protein